MPAKIDKFKSTKKMGIHIESVNVVDTKKINKIENINYRQSVAGLKPLGLWSFTFASFPAFGGGEGYFVLLCTSLHVLVAVIFLRVSRS